MLKNMLNILPLIISFVSMYLTHQYKKEQQILAKEQQKLKKEMQNNEFNFSRRKTWYDSQNQVLDQSLLKLTDVSFNVNELFTIVMEEIDPQNNQTKVFYNEVTEIKKAIQKNTNYLKANRHYFPKELVGNINSIIILNEELVEKIDPRIRILYSLKENEIDNIIENISSSIQELTTGIRNIFLD